MLSKIKSATIRGFQTAAIKVEVDLARGLPSFNIVGLPDKAVRESRERVRPAIKNSGYEFPVSKVTINLAPANLKKIGPHFDLPIAIGILAAQGNFNFQSLDDYFIVGELSLSGKIRKVNGVLPMAAKMKELGIKGMILPVSNFGEAKLVKNLKALPVRNLTEVVEFLTDHSKRKNFFQNSLDKAREAAIQGSGARNSQNEGNSSQNLKYEMDFSDLKGQQEAKRALEVAAAGRHNVLLIGPPGAGKTMLARRLTTIMPPLTEEEALELTKIYSIMGLIGEEEGLIKKRPFRAPHHSITRAGLIGGGRIPEPGEVSLSHFGTLFMDELPEFKRNVLEMLRQPLEEREVTIVRSSVTATFPADFTLLAAMNPCPCGYYGDERHECRCSLPQINRYRDKITGPLLDRIDLQIEVPGLEVKEITGNACGESSGEIKTRVIKAHNIQQKRFAEENINHNSQMSGKTLQKYCQVKSRGIVLLEEAIDRLGLSARAYDRILKLARTIADLSGKQDIQIEHLREAIQYRSFDRTL